MSQQTRTHPQRVTAALDALLTAHAAEIAAKDHLITELRAKNTALVKKHDALRRNHDDMKRQNTDMKRRLSSLRVRFGVTAVEATEEEDLPAIPAGKGSFRAVAEQLEITPLEVRSIAAGIDPHHLAMATIRRARQLLAAAA